jgi:hypothetical protein
MGSSARRALAHDLADLRAFDRRIADESLLTKD